MERVRLLYKGKRTIVSVKRCSFFGKFLGLMFSRRKSAPILLFDFERSVSLGIHSYFVFYDFLAIWLDEKNSVVEVSHVFPWTSYLRPAKPYVRLIEIPISSKNKKLIDFFTK